MTERTPMNHPPTKKMGGEQRQEIRGDVGDRKDHIKGQTSRPWKRNTSTVTRALKKTQKSRTIPKGTNRKGKGSTAKETGGERSGCPDKRRVTSLHELAAGGGGILTRQRSTLTFRRGASKKNKTRPGGAGGVGIGGLLRDPQG